jgi:voltage-gated sodium channel
MWLVFDGLLVVMGFIALFRHLVEHPQLILLLRLFRVFRIFRIFELNETLKDIEKKIISVVPTIATFLVLIFLILYAYAIVGMYMYDFEDDFNTIDFSGVYAAMTSLFVMMTNGWSDTLAELRSHHIVPDIYTDIYIISFFIFSVLVTLNVFLAVMTSQIQDKIDKNNSDEHQALKDADGQIMKMEKQQQHEIAELNAKLDAILKRLEKE